jgi:hypothetical protein
MSLSLTPCVFTHPTLLPEPSQLPTQLPTELPTQLPTQLSTRPVEDDIYDSCEESGVALPEVPRVKRTSLVLYPVPSPSVADIAEGKRAHKYARELRKAAKLYADGKVSLIMYRRLELGIRTMYKIK